MWNNIQGFINQNSPLFILLTMSQSLENHLGVPLIYTQTRTLCHIIMTLNTVSIITAINAFESADQSCQNRYNEMVLKWGQHTPGLSLQPWRKQTEQKGLTYWLGKLCSRKSSRGLASAFRRSTNVTWDKGISALSTYQLSRDACGTSSTWRLGRLHLHTSPKLGPGSQNRQWCRLDPQVFGQPTSCKLSLEVLPHGFTQRRVPKESLSWKILKTHFNVIRRKFLRIELQWRRLWNHKVEGLCSDSLLKALSFKSRCA